MHLLLLLLACRPGSPADQTAPNQTDDTASTDSGESQESADTAEDTGEEARAALEALLTEAFADAPAGVDGLRLLVHDADGVELIDLEVGVLPRDEALAVASASKLVSALALMRLVEEGALSLSDRVDSRVPSPGAYGAVTLDQLGAFVSGMPADDDCLSEARSTVAECAATLLATTPVASPGDRLDYGGAHLQVAGWMAEQSTGESWAQLFERTLREPLGLNAEQTRYYTFPQRRIGDHPLIAGGLVISIDDYDRLLSVAHKRGQLEETTFISEALARRLEENRYPSAEIGDSPMEDDGYDYRYSFGSWLHCEGTYTECPIVSSPGAYGFTPWIDHASGYRAILAMESEAPGGAAWAVPLAHSLMPWIAALAAP